MRYGLTMTGAVALTVVIIWVYAGRADSPPPRPDVYGALVEVYDSLVDLERNEARDATRQLEKAAEIAYLLYVFDMFYFIDADGERQRQSIDGRKSAIIRFLSRLEQIGDRSKDVRQKLGPRARYLMNMYGMAVDVPDIGTVNGNAKPEPLSHSDIPLRLSEFFFFSRVGSLSLVWEDLPSFVESAAIVTTESADHELIPQVFDLLVGHLGADGAAEQRYARIFFLDFMGSRFPFAMNEHRLIFDYLQTGYWSARSGSDTYGRHAIHAHLLLLEWLLSHPYEPHLTSIGLVYHRKFLNEFPTPKSVEEHFFRRPPESESDRQWLAQVSKRMDRLAALRVAVNERHHADGAYRLAVGRGEKAESLEYYVRVIRQGGWLVVE